MPERMAPPPSEMSQEVMGKKEMEVADPMLESIRDEVSQIVDAVGQPIDEGIVETVVYAKALDIPTLQSCEGHVDSGRPWPWVRVGNEDEPRERYVGQLDTYQRVADEHGVELEVVERAQDVDLWAKAERELGNAAETDEYLEWANTNGQVVARVQELLDEFYASREVDEDVKLELMTMAGNVAEIMPHEVNRKPVDWDNLSEEQLQGKIDRLPTRQAEMRAFTVFLRRKYQEN